MLSSCNDTPCLNDIKLPCLLYADDMILLSESKSGLQDQLDLLGNYCDKWFLKINPEKSQTMCIRPLRSKIESSNMSFTMNGSILKSTTSYVYLGAMINEKGNFKMQTDYMSSKALKAVYKLFKTISSLKFDICTQFHLFDHLIKPILLYAREATFSSTTLKNTEDLLCKNNIEKVHKLFIRSILGVHNRSPIDAIYGDTGRFPLYIETVVNMYKYYCKVNKNPAQSLVQNAMLEAEKMHYEGINTWFTPLAHILSDLGLDLKSNLNVLSLKSLLQAKFKLAWQVRIQKSPKLRTYIKFKTHFGLEPYLKHLREKIKRSQISKIRVSAHTLEIEKGRHKKERVHADQRFCRFCPNQVEDEQHFIIKCPKYDYYREKFYLEISKCATNFRALTDEEKLIWLFIMEDHDLIYKLASFLQICNEIRNLKTPG